MLSAQAEHEQTRACSCGRTMPRKCLWALVIALSATCFYEGGLCDGICSHPGTARAVKTCFDICCVTNQMYNSSNAVGVQYCYRLRNIHR